MIKKLTLPNFSLSDINIKTRSKNGVEKLFEYTFDDYLFGMSQNGVGLDGVLGDPWWRGQGANDNEARARIDSSLRIQESFETAKESNSNEVLLEDADLKWLIDRAQAFHLPQFLAPLNPKLIKFYKVLLNAVLYV